MVTLPRKFSTSSSPTTPAALKSYYIPPQLFRFHRQIPPPVAASTLLQRPQPQNHLESQLFSTLDACASLPHAKQVHAQILLQGLHYSSYLLTKLVRTLTKLNVPVEHYPRSVFDRVAHPNPFLYNALIRGYLVQGKLGEAVEVYGLMRRERTRPVSFMFSALFKACGEAMDAGLGRQFHVQTVLLGGLGSDLIVENAVLDMYGKCGYLACARKVFDEMTGRDVFSWTGLIVAYAKAGDMVSAQELFDESPKKDMVAWTAMVTGFSQNAKPLEAIEVFKRMQDANVETDEVSLLGVISACAQLGVRKYADWICNVAERYSVGYSCGVLVGSALIDMYSKCGNVDTAYRIFEGMKERNVYSYSSMILGFAAHGRAHDAMRLFDEMKRREIKPNNVTFLGVLSACSHTGQVEQGRLIFDSMEICYGVAPSDEHYTCLVDMLGRAGHLEEAFEVVKMMPIEPNGGVWGALLGACHIHGKPDIAEIAASHLFEIEPDGIGNYILLCNTYAAAGRWSDVSRVRKLMNTKSLKNNPGCSLFETKKGLIHEFYAGDMTHPRSGEIKRALEDLMGRLDANGYSPKLSSVQYDVSDEEKRHILLTHSEKLALAFGLISTDTGYTIKIVKNLRICEDCHLFMSAASQSTGREIVVRDKIRFHYFHDGTCSCNNFW